MTNKIFALTEEEAKALYDYLMNRAGYISYECDMLILLLIKKLRSFVD